MSLKANHELELSWKLYVSEQLQLCKWANHQPGVDHWSKELEMINKVLQPDTFPSFIKRYRETMAEIVEFNDPVEMERYHLSAPARRLYEKRKNENALQDIWAWIIGRPDWYVLKSSKRPKL
jgi:hypothetical protein